MNATLQGKISAVNQKKHREVFNALPYRIFTPPPYPPSIVSDARQHPPLTWLERALRWVAGRRWA